MSFIQSIIVSIGVEFLKWLSTFLLGKAEQKVKQIEDDKKANEIDKANAKDYRDAQTHEDQLEAAKHLLNRTRP